MCCLCPFIDNRICAISSNKQSRHSLLNYGNEIILILQYMMATTNRNSVYVTTKGLVRFTIHDKAVDYAIAKMLKGQNVMFI